MRMSLLFLLMALAARGEGAQNSSGGEVLYNSIVLPRDWPPEVNWEDIKARKPLAEPPYLQSPPAIVCIDAGRQLLVDDFLIERSTLKRTCHLARYYTNVDDAPAAISG